MPKAGDAATMLTKLLKKDFEVYLKKEKSRFVCPIAQLFSRPLKTIKCAVK